ncbi:hypothetical protein B9Z65_1860 [Elsinoe australis]|uniref:PPM-type phosphatase domain-containing protein n=1 Tax=Elsinoe australis TaxID=40998 RepID=A0A2P7YL35_9PEZI|nr:hypothetical protein B9Z65_1860 [Elsinoe australis]
MALGEAFALAIFRFKRKESPISDLLRSLWLNRSTVFDRQEDLTATESRTTSSSSMLAAQQSGSQCVFPIAPKTVTNILRRFETSDSISTNSTPIRYDSVQVPCNLPLEDDQVEAIFPAPYGFGNGEWLFWGIYDGHNGWSTSARLREDLINTVYKKLSVLDPKAVAGTVYPMADTIIQAFEDLDRKIVLDAAENVRGRSKAAAVRDLGAAISGSCAILAFYDTTTNILRIANTGDSRAVLGKKEPDGRWTAHGLSIDHYYQNQREYRRVRADHPGEEKTVFAYRRLLGEWEALRSFGDASHKWSKKTSLELRKTCFARAPPRDLKTPPYLTAEPAVVAMRIPRGNGDFCVLASDALWKSCSSEEVVDLSSPKLPVVEGSNKTVGRRKHRPGQWSLPDGPERFDMDATDDNVATYLARNALGEKDHDTISALLTPPLTNARRFRDDLTITVVFFGDERNSIRKLSPPPNDLSLANVPAAYFESVPMIRR